VLCPAAIAGGAAALHGAAGVAFFLVQAAVGVLMLEAVNYIEHYGLTRRKLLSGE
jgi:alkane 1-monooxygenase